MSTNEKVIEYMAINNCNTKEAMEAVIGNGAFEALAARVWTSINARNAINRIQKGLPTW